jgi:small subunit ribosomal protein S9
MADDATPQDEQEPTPAAEEPRAAQDIPAAEAEQAPAEAAAPEPTADEQPVAEGDADAAEAAEPEPAAADEAEPEPAAAAEAEPEPAAAAEAEPEPAAAAEPEAVEPAAGEAAAAEPAAAEEDDEDDEPTPRVRPAIPGMDLQPDIVPEGVDPLARTEAEVAEDAAAQEAEDRAHEQPVAASIDLGASARYTATGKRKTAIARVLLKPGTGAYTVNGKTLNEFFPRPTLQRNIRQPLEAVGYEDRMDVVATMTGGGVSAQAGALRHGVSRALLEADPNLRGELKRRGFLTRDSRAKERKKAGLKKARKRPQFSKR